MISLQFDVASVRKNKGKNALKAVDDYVVLDVETTGLDPVFNDIIEIGLVRVRQGNISDRFQSLVNPGYALDSFISELTGITDDMLISAPKLEEIMPSAISFIGDDFVVAHNANFDINFMYDSCLKLELLAFKNDFIDTMRLSRRLFPEFAHHRLTDLIQRFKISDTVEHRALKDAIQTHACYEYLKRYIADNNIELENFLKRADKISAKDITTDKTDFDENSPIFGKQFVFTGTLEKMVRKDAMQIVVDSGGTCGDSVTKKTNYLVLGNNDYCKTIKGGKSSKQKKAESLKLSGFDIEILSENVFYDMISQLDLKESSTLSDQKFSSDESTVQLSEDEQEAFGYICEALSEIHVKASDMHVERRSENYLSIVSGKGQDFCRIKLSKNSKWISLSMWHADDEVKNNPIFDNVSNKNARHWKIFLRWTGDIQDLYDLVQISYISDHE